MLDISFLQVLDLKEKWDKYGRNWKKPDTASPYFLVQVLEMGSPVFFGGNGFWNGNFHSLLNIGWNLADSHQIHPIHPIFNISNGKYQRPPKKCWILFFFGRPGGTSHFWQRLAMSSGLVGSEVSDEWVAVESASRLGPGLIPRYLQWVKRVMAKMI